MAATESTGSESTGSESSARVKNSLWHVTLTPPGHTLSRALDSVPTGSTPPGVEALRARRCRMASNGWGLV